MTGTIHDFYFAGRDGDAAPGASPCLPVEGHIVAAALNAERLRALAAQMLMLLQHSPRDVALFDRLQNEILSAWTDLDDRYRAYRAVLTCEGQA